MLSEGERQNMHVPWSVVKGPHVACLFLVWRSILIFRYDEALNLNHRLHYHTQMNRLALHLRTYWPTVFSSVILSSETICSHQLSRSLFYSASFIVGKQIWVKYSQFLLCFLKLKYGPLDAVFSSRNSFFFSRLALETAVPYTSHWHDPS